MGLDSIELVIRFEKEFKKEISDQEVEKINTIEDMANWFYNNLSIHESEKNIQAEIFNLLKNAFSELGWQSHFSYKDIIGDFVPKHNLIKDWQALAQQLNLEIPQLSTQDLRTKELTFSQSLGLIFNKPQPPILTMDFDRFITCIAALNYEKFVDFDNLTSLFEITIAVIGITENQIGIYINEIFPHSSFVKDLGID